MSKRLQIVLPDPAAAQLEELAAAAGQPAATLASQMVRNEIALADKAGTVRPLRSTQLPIGRRTRARPRWLPPCGDSRGWRADMWGAIVALHGRYPRALGALKEAWWTDESHTETLCALAVWRADIDDTGQDPREELAFQSHIDDYAQALRQQGGGVTKAWEPGMPPIEWIA